MRAFKNWYPFPFLLVVLAITAYGCGGSSESHHKKKNKSTPTPTPTATPTPAPNACLPSSSIAVLVNGTDATAYVPRGNWGGGSTGVEVVPIESSAGIGLVSKVPLAIGTPTLVDTPQTVNSCSSN
jgi:hypothetical protein